MPETGLMNPVAMALGLVGYNNTMNRWPSFHGSAYVPANLALTAASVVLARRLWDLDRRDLGLGGGQGAGLLLGTAMGAAAAAPLFGTLWNRRAAAVVADERVGRVSRAQLVHRAVLRVPLGTALPEEILFRGVLYGALSSRGRAGALWSSAAFGLWHIAPTYNLLQENKILSGRPVPAAGLVSGAVLVTMAAGVFLVRLRVVTGGIAAPFALHATLNSLATVAAYLGRRRQQ